MKKAVIILPTYNEAGNIKEVVEKILIVTEKCANWDTDVIVVDSKSQDKTEDIVKDLKRKHKKIHLLIIEKEGLGKAYVYGFNYAINKLGAFVVFEMDADLSHEPEKIPEFLDKIEKGADFVIGSRYIKGGSIPSNWGLYRKFLSVPGNLIIRLGFMKLKITDWTSGFRAIKSWVVNKSLPKVENRTGYVFQVALLDNAILNHARIAEVPINFRERKEGVSKINSFQTIIETLFYVFTQSSFIKFVVVGLLGFIIDFGVSYFFIERLKTAIWTGTLLSTETAIISNFFMNNFWSFAHKKIEHRGGSYLKSFAKFNLISSGSIIIQTVGIQLFSTLLGSKLWYAYKVFIIFFIVIPYSYFFYNKFVWKEK